MNFKIVLEYDFRYKKQTKKTHQLDEVISLKEQVSEIAHLKSEFLALKTELPEVKEQNKRYEKKMSELITYSIFHTKNTKTQEEICFEGRQIGYSFIHLNRLLMRIFQFYLQHHQPW